MSNFKSLGDFRAALNGLVAQTSLSARGNPRRKARRNMAVRQLPSGGWEFDTPQEAMEFSRLQSATGAEVRAPQIGTGRAPRPTRAPRASGTPGQVNKPKGFKGQCSLIGKSIGGLMSYSPQLAGQQVAGGAHVQALSQMGLTPQKADAVLDAMLAEGVASWAPTHAGAARARQILTEVGGVGVQAAANPWAIRNMAGRPRQFGLPAAPFGDPKYMKLPAGQLQAMAQAGDHAAFIELSRRSAGRGMRQKVEAPAARAAKRSAFKKGDVILAFGSGPGVILELLPRDKTGLQWYLVDFGPGGHQPAAETHLTIGPARSRVAANPTIPEFKFKVGDAVLVDLRMGDLRRVHGTAPARVTEAYPSSDGGYYRVVYPDGTNSVLGAEFLSRSNARTRRSR